MVDCLLYNNNYDIYNKHIILLLDKFGQLPVDKWPEKVSKNKKIT